MLSNIGNRLSYCVTLLLADVATLQLLFDNLPNIPYWTLFDLYMTWFVQNYTGYVHIIRAFCLILIVIDATAYLYHQCIFASH